MNVLEGTIASRGYAYGQAYLWREGRIALQPEKITCIETEKQRLRQSIHAVLVQMQEMEAKAEQLLDAETVELFQSYQVLLDDEELVQAIEEQIEADQVGAAWAVQQVMGAHADAIARLENAYLRERATDIRDLQQRLIKDLLGQGNEPLPDLTDRILVAEDLSPAQSVQLNLQTLQGLLTDRGGLTSHTSILARALNIPAIVGTRCATQVIRDEDWILMDAIGNKIWVNPERSLVQQYEASRERQRQQDKELAALVSQPGRTADGRPIILAANIGLPSETALAKAAGAEGIGLFRTEFIFMNRTDVPDEEEQFAAYRSVIEAMQPHPVIIRTMDIGGDKDVPYLQLSKEDNPFLGLRGVRLSLKRRDLFRTQLRALLRASAYGSLKIMFPMVSCVEELIEIQSFWQEIRNELPHIARVDIGIMIETPASAMIADHLIRYVDFFSIGTNDLTQYTMAVDRGHVDIRELYQPLSPAVLLMIQRAAQAAVRAGKWVGVCGELAGDPLAALLLAGLGVTELSMSAGSIGRVKHLLLQTQGRDLQERAEKALHCATAAEVRTLLDAWGAELPLQ